MSFANKCSSVTELCPTLCNPIDYSMPGFPILHELLEPAQTHVHRIGDVIQPSHLCKQRQFYFFPNFDSFYFSSLIAMSRTSKTMLNKSDKDGYPCLVPDLRGNAFRFSPLRMMFAVICHKWPLLC